MSLLKTGDGQPRGPNLLGKADVAASQADGHRILSQLEHGALPATVPAAARWRPALPRIAIAASAVGAAALIVALLVDAPAPVPAPAPPMVTGTLAAPRATAASAATAAPSLAPPLPAAATIVNDAMPPAVTQAPAPATTVAAPRKTPPARQAAVRAPAARPATAAPGDSDVTLLTAMVAHAHRQEGTQAPVRDVVLRRGEEDTPGLLQRCKQLGLIEGMLCRSRICSGRWDSDPACH